MEREREQVFIESINRTIWTASLSRHREDDIQLLSLENIEVDRVATRVGFSTVVAKSRQNEVSSPPCHSDTPLAASG